MARQDNETPNGSAPMSDPRPLPSPDPETAPYWAAAREHKLCMQRCARCQRFTFPPKPICPDCGEPTLEWTRLSGRGKVHTFTVMRDTFIGGFTPPYTLVEVELDEQPGLMLLTNLLDCPPEQVRIGMPVEVTFEQRSADITVPQFRPTK